MDSLIPDLQGHWELPHMGSQVHTQMTILRLTTYMAPMNL